MTHEILSHTAIKYTPDQILEYFSIPASHPGLEVPSSIATVYPQPPVRVQRHMFPRSLSQLARSVVQSNKNTPRFRKVLKRPVESSGRETQKALSEKTVPKMLNDLIYYNSVGNVFAGTISKYVGLGIDSVDANEVSMLTEPVWFYLDNDGEAQGPFSTARMYNWSIQGYFYPELRVSNDDCRNFKSLGELCKPADLSKKGAKTKVVDGIYEVKFVKNGEAG